MCILKILRANQPVKLLQIFILVFAIAIFKNETSAAGTPEQTTDKLAKQALDHSGAMEIVTDLTTEIGPRLFGSDAEKRAAFWAQQRMQQLGFDKIWTENFPVEHGWARGIEKADIVAPSPQALMVTALGGSVATPVEGLEAEIALFKNYQELLAAPAGSLKGKIAVVTQRMVRTQNGAGYSVANKIRTLGPSEAARRGAVGYLLRSLGTEENRRVHTGATHYAEDAPRIPAAAMSGPDAEQLERLVEKGGAVRIKMILTPSDLGPVISQNVIGEITGREKTNEIVLIGAHLDSWDLGTGAIDDGAGVAIVLAATKLIHDLPERPRRTIRVVLFGSEEIGILGGEAYAKTHKAELTNVIIAAEPDFGQGPVYQFQTGVTNVNEPTLKRIAAALLPLGILPGNNLSHGESDVEPLFVAHVPVVTLALDGSDYFDLHHTPDDTLDKIKPERINQSAAAYAVFTWLAAELGGDYRVPAPAPVK